MFGRRTLKSKLLVEVALNLQPRPLIELHMTVRFRCSTV